MKCPDFVRQFTSNKQETENLAFDWAGGYFSGLNSAAGKNLSGMKQLNSLADTYANEKFGADIFYGCRSHPDEIVMTEMYRIYLALPFCVVPEKYKNIH